MSGSTCGSSTHQGLCGESKLVNDVSEKRLHACSQPVPRSLCGLQRSLHIRGLQCQVWSTSVIEEILDWGLLLTAM